MNRVIIDREDKPIMWIYLVNTVRLIANLSIITFTTTATSPTILQHILPKLIPNILTKLSMLAINNATPPLRLLTILILLRPNILQQ
jgi:hypothetical protein